MEITMNSKFNIGDHVIDECNQIFMITDFLYSAKYHHWIVKYMRITKRMSVQDINGDDMVLEYFEKKFKYYC